MPAMPPHPPFPHFHQHALVAFVLFFFIPFFTTDFGIISGAIAAAAQSQRKSHDMFVTLTNNNKNKYQTAPNANVPPLLLLEQFHLVQWESEQKRLAIGGCIPYINRDGTQRAVIKYQQMCRLRRRRLPLLTMEIVFRSGEEEGEGGKEGQARELRIDMWKQQLAVAQQMSEVITDKGGGQFVVNVDVGTQGVTITTTTTTTITTTMAQNNNNNFDVNNDGEQQQQMLVIGGGERGERGIGNGNNNGNYDGTWLDEIMTAAMARGKRAKNTNKLI